MKRLHGNLLAAGVLVAIMTGGVIAIYTIVALTARGC